MLYNLIKEKLINLIEWTFKREGSPYIACNERQAFFTSGDIKRYKLWSWYERDFMMSLSGVKQAEIIEAFKSTSRYLDDLLNIDIPYFEGMVNRMYPPELQLNKANTSDTEAPFLDLHLSISNGFVSSKIYDKCDDFDFGIVKCSIFGW